jgi:2-polyprenyl-6-methoxyphenol hydroxylase-like FAD-dependent oxidoreductase
MPRAIVIGGSLGGLFAGCTLRRAGWDVAILERSANRLEGRGAGLGVHPPMLQGLLAAGTEVDGSVGITVSGRTAFGRDGRVVGEIHMPQFCTSWARLYSMLSAAFPEECVNRGAVVTSFAEDTSGVMAQLADGSEVRGDVLIAADGVRSTIRRQMFPDVGLVYAGYIAWRGMVDEAALSPVTHAAIFHRFGWGLIDGEHILGYPVPGAGDDLTPGRRRYSFVWYRPVTPETLAEMQTDATGRAHPEGIPPHLIRPEFVAALRRDAESLLAPVWVEILHATAQPLFQPIGDLESPTMSAGRVALLGDAAFVARPHVAKGAIKAGHDAMALATALADRDVVDGLCRYDAVRRPESQSIVTESRRLGAYLERKGARTADPVAFMQENGGVEASNRTDGGLFFRLLAEAGLD